MQREREGGCKAEFDCPDDPSGKAGIKPLKSPHIETITFFHIYLLYLFSYIINTVRVASFMLCLPTIAKT